MILPPGSCAPLTMTPTPSRSVSALSHSRVCGLTFLLAENGIHAAVPYFLMIGAFEVGGTQPPAQQASVTQATVRRCRIDIRANGYLGTLSPNPWDLPLCARMLLKRRLTPPRH